jgi:hypothetical protein
MVLELRISWHLPSAIRLGTLDFHTHLQVPNQAPGVSAKVTVRQVQANHRMHCQLSRVFEVGTQHRVPDARSGAVAQHAGVQGDGADTDSSLRRSEQPYWQRLSIFAQQAEQGCAVNLYACHSAKLY